MPTDREMLKRDEREARQLRGEGTPFFGIIRRTRKGKRGGPRPTDPDYHEQMAKQTYVTGPAKTYSLGTGVGKGNYWYIFGFTLEGKKAMYGPKHSEAEVLEAGRNLDRVETFNYDTRDKSRAWSQIKAHLIERGDDPDFALARTAHVEPKKHSILGRR